MLAVAANDYAAVKCYACDGEFFWDITVDASSSLLLRDALALAAADIQGGRALTSRCIRHVKDIYKGIISLSYVPLIDADLDVDFWLYRTYGERS